MISASTFPNCKYAAIFDKDFCTAAENVRFVNSNVLHRLGNGAWVHIHDGYCIESVLFSDRAKLINYLLKLTGNENEQEIRYYVNMFYSKIEADLRNVRSELYGNMKGKFASQKKPTRPELERVEFDDYAGEASEKVQYAMLKDNIKKFVLDLEGRLGQRLIERETMTKVKLFHQKCKYIYGNSGNIRRYI